MLVYMKKMMIFRYPRQKDQGAAFEKSIAPVDMILYFECKDVSNCITVYIYTLSRNYKIIAFNPNENKLKKNFKLFSFIWNTISLI